MEEEIKLYLKNLSPQNRKSLKYIRKVAIKYLKKNNSITEKISYGMPSIWYDGKAILYYGSFTKHLSIFPPTKRFTSETLPSEEEIHKYIKDILIKKKIFTHEG